MPRGATNSKDVDEVNEVGKVDKLINFTSLTGQTTNSIHSIKKQTFDDRSVVLDIKKYLNKNKIIDTHYVNIEIIKDTVKLENHMKLDELFAEDDK